MQKRHTARKNQALFCIICNISKTKKILVKKLRDNIPKQNCMRNYGAFSTKSTFNNNTQQLFPPSDKRTQAFVRMN